MTDKPLVETKPPFDALVEAHSAEIYRYLWRMTYNTTDAEDCLQDTFLRVLRAYPRLSADSNFRAYLYKVATNVAHTHAVRRNRQNHRHTELLDIIPSPNLSPAEQTAENELLTAVFTAVNALPHKQRAAFMMRQYQDMDYPEIAAALDTSEDSARANVYQALRKLRQQFQVEG
ncbi:MAG: RNA polymerase sigma factor FecI [Anaerolineales bacterium]